MKRQRRIVTDVNAEVEKERKKAGRLTTAESKKRKRAMLKALRERMGIVTYAARDAGIPPKTHYYWLRTDHAYAEKVLEILELQKDFVEWKFLQKIEEGDANSIWRYLTTKARDRGYIPIHRQETSGVNGRPIEVNETMTVTDMREHITQDELDEIVSKANERRKRRQEADKGQHQRITR